MSTPTSSVFSDLKSESPALLASCIPACLGEGECCLRCLGEGVLACWPSSTPVLCSLCPPPAARGTPSEHPSAQCRLRDPHLSPSTSSRPPPFYSCLTGLLLRQQASAPGPFHVLVPLPEMLFPQSHTAYLLYISVKGHLLCETLCVHTI